MMGSPRDVADGHERTHAPQQTASFDQLIGTATKRQRDSEPKRTGGLRVDDQIDFGRLLNR
jgi:hypothetical protein